MVQPLWFIIFPYFPMFVSMSSMFPMKLHEIAMCNKSCSWYFPGISLVFPHNFPGISHNLPMISTYFPRYFLKVNSHLPGGTPCSWSSPASHWPPPRPGRPRCRPRPRRNRPARWERCRLSTGSFSQGEKAHQYPYTPHVWYIYLHLGDF